MTGPELTNARTLARLTDGFVTSMSGLEKTLLIVMAEVTRHHSRAHKRFDEFAARGTCEVFEEEDGTKGFKPKSHDYCQEFSELTTGLDMTHVATRTVPRSFLVALVSQYDFFIRSFFRSILLAKPDLMKGSHRTLEISRLLTFDAIPDAYQRVIEEEMDDLMRQNHPSQFEYMETRFNIGKWEQDPLWRAFIEVTERRNLFVHTDGFVSNQYLEVCRQNNVNIGVISEGDELRVTPDYFRHAYETLLEMGIKVSQILWRKQFPEQAKESDRSISNTTYDLLMTKRYGLARNLLGFATTRLKNRLHDEKELLYFKVNLAIALKNLDNKVEFAKCMASEEWHKKEELFQLAEAVLNERYHDAFILMRKVRSGVHKADYRRWPLYEKFRNLPEFRVVFREIFGEDVDSHDHSHTPLTISDHSLGDSTPVQKDSATQNQITTSPDQKFHRS